jgi:GNAT superfamily N-acetyltransferase
MENVQIVRAYPRHRPLVVPLFDQYRQFYGEPSDEASVRMFIAERMEKGDSAIFLAVEGEGSKERGLGLAQLYPMFSSTAMKPSWLLSDLFVDPSARRRGVGAALMQRARKFAWETRACEIMLQTAVTNKQAQSLYESLGWRRDTEFLTYMLKVTDAS